MRQKSEYASWKSLHLHRRADMRLLQTRTSSLGKDWFNLKLKKLYSRFRQFGNGYLVIRFHGGLFAKLQLNKFYCTSSHHRSKLWLFCFLISLENHCSNVKAAAHIWSISKILWTVEDSSPTTITTSSMLSTAPSKIFISIHCLQKKTSIQQDGIFKS